MASNDEEDLNSTHEPDNERSPLLPPQSTPSLRLPPSGSGTAPTRRLSTSAAVIVPGSSLVGSVRRNASYG